MPVLDHFQPPVSVQCPWQSLHSAWIAALVRRLNLHTLPPEYMALGRAALAPNGEADAAVLLREPRAVYDAAPAHSGEERAGYVPPPPDEAVPGVFLPEMEVRIVWRPGGNELVGAIELVSPGNKDCPETRHAFAAKIQAYLQRGISVVVADLVTERRASLHAEWLSRFVDSGPEVRPPSDRRPLYAVAYHPTGTRTVWNVELWLREFGVGEPIPGLPLFLRGGEVVPVELELTYMEACADHRITGNERSSG